MTLKGTIFKDADGESWRVTKANRYNCICEALGKELSRVFTKAEFEECLKNPNPAPRLPTGKYKATMLKVTYSYLEVEYKAQTKMTEEKLITKFEEIGRHKEFWTVNSVDYFVKDLRDFNNNKV